MTKVEGINGDLLKDNMGMSDSDRQRLKGNLDIVINSAASVKFDEPLHDALAINYYGSQRVQQLALDCNSELFIQVSTAYVNCNHFGTMEERIYEGLDPTIVDWLDSLTPE